MSINRFLYAVEWNFHDRLGNIHSMIRTTLRQTNIMGYKWSYIPVSIRLISEKEDVHALSGVHIIAEDEYDEILHESIVTINHIPKVDIDGKYEVYLTAGCFNEGVDVSWYPCRWEFHVPVVERTGDALFRYLNFFKENGFKLVPNDTVTGNTVMDLSVSGLGLKTGRLSRLVDRELYRSVEFSQAETTDPIAVHSFPFNFTNPLLFSDFQSTGTVNLKIEKESEILGYLSDIKYMDNMAGGIVNLPNTTRSIGILIGNLRKFNGDGDLLFILPWSTIWSRILTKFPNWLTPSKTPIRKPAGRPNSILPVVVSEKKELIWGSCILFNDNTIITNHHVIKQYIDRPTTVACTIFLSKTKTLKLSEKDTIITPHSKLDLSFIKLSIENCRILNTVDNILPVEYEVNYHMGDSVSAIGYGLYFNNLVLEPLESTGSISTIYSLPLYKDSYKDVRSMVVTSSSCWNGSSGGGLFKRSSNKLIGIICSNAQIILPTFDDVSNSNTTEKLSKLSLCIPIEVILHCYENLLNTEPELNDKIGDMWNLVPYHNDLIIEKPKL